MLLLAFINYPVIKKNDVGNRNSFKLMVEHVSDSVLIEDCFVDLSLLFLKLGGSKWIFGFVCSQTLFIYLLQPSLMFIPHLFCLRTT